MQLVKKFRLRGRESSSSLSYVFDTIGYFIQLFTSQEPPCVTCCNFIEFTEMYQPHFILINGGSGDCCIIKWGFICNSIRYKWEPVAKRERKKQKTRFLGELQFVQWHGFKTGIVGQWRMYCNTRTLDLDILQVVGAPSALHQMSLSTLRSMGKIFSGPHGISLLAIPQENYHLMLPPDGIGDRTEGAVLCPVLITHLW